MSGKLTKKTKIVLGVVGGFMFLCVCGCVGFYLLGKWAESDPHIQATGTARAIVRATGTALAIAQATVVTNSNDFLLLTSTSAQPKTLAASLTSTRPPTIASPSTRTPTITSKLGMNITLLQSANIRSGPGVNYSVVRGAANGEILTIYGKNEDGTWILIDEVNQYWVKASLGTLSNPIESIPIAPTPIPTLTPTITQTSTSTKTRTPVPTNTLPPTRTPIPPIYLDDIYYNSKHMTEYQFSEYKSDIAGKPIREYVTIANVDENGRVVIYGEWMDNLFNLYDYCVAISGVPSEIAVTLDSRDEVYLEATINRFVGDWNYYYNCEVTLVLYYVKITQ